MMNRQRRIVGRSTPASEISGVPGVSGPGIPGDPRIAPLNSSLAERAVLIGLIAASVALAALLVADIARYAI